jgi:serine/threonine-protein kinase
MTKQLKAIAPRAQTPAPVGSSGIRTSGRLPEDLLREQVRRLVASSLVIAACWMFGLAMDTVVVPAMGFPRKDLAIVIEIAGIALSAAMFAYLRASAHRSETKTTMGLVFMVLNAFGIAIMNAEALGAAMPNIPMVSWTAVLILIFATISPTSPRRMLTASLAAATMDPLVALIGNLRGLPAPRAMAVLHYLPNYVAALIAMVPYGDARPWQTAAGGAGLAAISSSAARPGGMGEVWRAKHRLLARNAAIKLVRPKCWAPAALKTPR